MSPIHCDLDEEDGDDDGVDYCDGVDFCGSPFESKRTTWGLKPSHSVHFRIWFTRGLISLHMRWMLCMWQISCLDNCCASFASRVSCVSCLQLHLFVLFFICLVNAFLCFLLCLLYLHICFCLCLFSICLFAVFGKWFLHLFVFFPSFFYLLDFLFVCFVLCKLDLFIIISNWYLPC